MIPELAPSAAAPASAITLSLDSTYIRSCHEGERHLEVRVGSAEASEGSRQVFGAVVNADTDIVALIRRTLDTLGYTGDTVLTAFTDGCSSMRSILAAAGLRVGTSLTEGTANFLVNQRMAKSQQIRWSRRGADLLLQVRCAIYNGALGSGFGQLFELAPG